MIKIQFPLFIFISASTYKAASFFIFTTSTFITPLTVEHIKANSFHHISVSSIRQTVFTSIKSSTIWFSNNSLIFCHVSLTANTHITVSTNGLKIPRNRTKSFTHFLIFLKFHLILIMPNFFLNTKSMFHIQELSFPEYIIYNQKLYL